jgi:DNA-binding transcriptional regulator YiaG
LAIKSDPSTPLNPFASRAVEKQEAPKVAPKQKAKPAKAARIAKSQRAAALDPQPAPLIEHASAEAPPRILSPGQVAAARSLMGLSQTQFGELAGLSRATVSRIEEPKPGGPKPTAKAWRAINATIEARGVKVLDDDGNEGIGVRLAASSRKP